MRAATRVLAAAALTVALGASTAAQADPFPEVIGLPDGWGAEGIAAGPGTTVYSGSLSTGAVYQADLRTGAGSVLVPGGSGRPAVGLKHSRGLLFVAGGNSGVISVHDARTGAEVLVHDVGGGFVNDVAVTEDAAWFTDSSRPVLYRLPLNGGRPSGDPVEVPLGGEWAQVPGFNANGIEATPDGRALLVVNTTTGLLYRVDPASGEAAEVQSDTSLTRGDGILLRGKDLAVVRNRLNEIAILRLSPDLTSASLVGTLTDPDFAIPTTVAAFGTSLYAVNARFGLPDGPYTIVKVDGS
jgi:sugar lactone lactonase YvrE